MKILNNISIFFKSLSKNIETKIDQYLFDPEKHGVFIGSIISSLVVFFAKTVGVDERFIKRERHMRETKVPRKICIKFIVFYISLELRFPLSSLYFDYSKFLETEVERNTTKKLLELYIKSKPSVQSQIIAQTNLFRLESVGLNNPHVFDFYKELLDKASVDKKKYLIGVNQESIFNDLKSIDIWFKENNVSFFLHSLTLLGVIRENKFISKKLHLAVFNKNFIRDFIDSGSFLGNTVFKILKQSSFAITLLGEEGTEIIVSIVEVDNESIVISGGDDIHLYYFTPFNLTTINFCGIDVSIPDYYERHLQENFGNWRNNNIYFDYSYDIPARVYKKNTKSLMYLTDYLCNALSNSWRDASYRPAKELKKLFGIDYTNNFPNPKGDLSVPKQCMRYEKKYILFIGVFDSLDSYFLDIISSSFYYADFIKIGVLSDNCVKNNKIKTRYSEKERVEIAHAIRGVKNIYIENMDEKAFKKRLYDENLVTTIVSKTIRDYFSVALVDELNILFIDDSSLSLTNLDGTLKIRTRLSRYSKLNSLSLLG